MNRTVQALLFLLFLLWFAPGVNKDCFGANTDKNVSNGIRPANQYKALELLKPGTARYGWTMDANGMVSFRGRFVVKADPSYSELRFSGQSPIHGVRYVVLADDKGNWNGYVFSGKGLLVSIPNESAQLLSDVMFLSEHERRAVILDGGELQEHAYLVNLETGRVKKYTIGSLTRSDCEIQWLCEQPGKFIGDSLFQLTVKIEKNPWDAQRCRSTKTRFVKLSIPLN